MARKDKDPSTVKAKKKRNRKSSEYRLPPGVKMDDYGFYMTMKGIGENKKRMEVIIDTDPERGRQIANQRDACYWDANVRVMLYRGIKVLGRKRVPTPPIPEGMYTLKFPGWKPRHKQLDGASTMGSRAGTGEIESVMGVDDAENLVPDIPKNITLSEPLGDGKEEGKSDESDSEERD